MTAPFEVSVAIPTRDRIDYLHATLASIVAQTRRPDRIFVVDNSVTRAAEVEALCASFGPGVVTYVPPLRDLSMNENHQRALSQLQGRYGAVMQDDDVWEPTFVERAVESLEANPRAVLFAVNYGTIDGAGRWMTDNAWSSFGAGTLPARVFLERVLLEMNPVHLSASMLRLDAVAVTGFVENDRTCSDLGLMLRLAAGGEVVFLDESLAKIRIHEGSDSNRQGWYGGLTLSFRPIEWEVKERFFATAGARNALGTELPRIRRAAARRLAQEYWSVLRSRQAPFSARRICLRNLLPVLPALRSTQGPR